MKKIIFLNLIAILALFTGCREEIPEYSGASGIYFAMSKTKGGLDDSKLDYTDNTSLPFAVFDKEDSILIVRVKIRTLGIKFDQYLKEMEAKGQTIYEDYRDSEGNLVKMTAGEGIQY